MDGWMAIVKEECHKKNRSEKKLFLIAVSYLAVGFLKSLKTYSYDSGSAECPFAIFMPTFIP